VVNALDRRVTSALYTHMFWDLMIYMSCILVIPHSSKFMLSYQREVNKVTL